MRPRIFSLLVVLVVAAVSCSSDPTTSDEFQALEEELATAQEQLAVTAAARDQLADQVAAAEARHDKVAAAQEAIADIIADPSAFGTEDEALDALMSYATPDAVMDDVAFGSIGMRQGWRNTLRGSDAAIETFATWTADDGSMAGSLWVWSGTASNGEPFSLVGINTDHFNEDGLITYSLVEWPYAADYVTSAFRTGN